MLKPLILVTGAAGKTGASRHVVLLSVSNHGFSFRSSFSLGRPSRRRSLSVSGLDEVA